MAQSVIYGAKLIEWRVIYGAERHFLYYLNMVRIRKMNNYVAKHARKYNKSAVMRDRKKDMKRGYVKHKGSQ